MPAPGRDRGTSRAGESMLAPGDSRKNSGDPTVLFDEYVQGVLDGRPPDVETLCRRAGDRGGDLQAMIGVARLLQDIREGAADAVLPPDEPPHETVELERLGRFLQLRPLGEGGLSRVYRARDPQLHREVALKVLSVPAGTRREWVVNEGRSLAHLSHPGVVRVNSLEEDEGRPFLVMDLVPGPSLREVLAGLRERAGSLDPGEAPPVEAARAAAARLEGVAARCELVARMAEALDYCHRSGVIHRDIKPHNVLLAEGDQPVLIDFGLAHLDSETEAGTNITQRLVGTPAYIAPEQVYSNRTGASALSDQFSLGVLLYELITLRHPFRLATRMDTLTAISRAAPPSPRRLDPGLPQDLERIALHALERAPGARYPDCAALAADLRAFLQHRAISLQAPTPLQAARLWLRRNRRGASVAAAAAGVLAVAWLASGVVRLRLDRADFAADMSSLSDRLPSLTQPDEVQSAYMELKAIKDRAGPLESRLFAPLFGSLRPQVAALSDVCSRRLDELVSKSLKPGMEPMQVRTALLLWSPALTLDRLTCPDSDVNRLNRDRGLADLPALDLAAGDAVRVERLLPDGDRVGILQHEPVEPDGGSSGARPLSSGTYRIVVRRGGGRPCEETDQIVRVEEPRRQIATRPPPATDGGTFALCPGGAVDLPETRDAKGDVALAAQHIDVPPCFLGASLVTWAEFEAVLPEARRSFEARRPEDVPPEAPAVVPWRLASEYAQAIGARLPSALELHLGWKAPGVALPAPEAGITGEWICNVSSVSEEMNELARYSGRDSARDVD